MNFNITEKTATILVFDSGIGGLSVYSEIKKLLPDLNYIYAMDNAGFPYGDKSDEIIISRVNKIIRQISQLYPIDIAIIACNTASTICLPILRKTFNIPIVGVVPAIKPAIAISKNKHIGLLATKATIRRDYTADLIKQFAEGCHIELLGLSELAIMAEDKLQKKAVDMKKLKQLLTPWRSLAITPDTIVLGCTHYPFIKPELATLFPAAIFIDSGHAIANRVTFLLNDIKLSRKKIDNQLISTLDFQSINYLRPILNKYYFYNFSSISI